MLYEIHMIKNYPPVNLNRDDTGSPKTCYFGGVQRGRVSSQCLKRTWRTSELYEKLLGATGIRTRVLPELLAETLRARGADEDFIAEAARKATGIANKEGSESDKGITNQIIFYSGSDIDAVADMMEKQLEAAGSVKAFAKLKAKDIAKAFDDAHTRPITLDIALFGRMVTSDAFRNVEASMQVAHAISTHAVNQESDFFTAVDDLIAGSDDLGAGMMGDIDYNACCFYHYAAIDTDILRENLKDSPDAEKLIGELLPAIIRVMAFSNPSGKQNSFAGHILPSMMCVEIKDTKIPVSYANSFAKPVNSRSRDMVVESVGRVVNEINKLDSAFGIETERCWFCPDCAAAPEKANVCVTLDELCDKCAEAAGR